MCLTILDNLDLDLDSVKTNLKYLDYNIFFFLIPGQWLRTRLHGLARGVHNGHVQQAHIPQGPPSEVRHPEEGRTWQ